MDPVFSEIYTKPDNDVFKVVFYPDRIYHAAYLNATVSQRYRYNVREVRNKTDITLMKAEVYQDGQFLANLIRIEYRASRLNETTRENGRLLQSSVMCTLMIHMPDGEVIPADVKLNYDSWIRAYQCEIWDTLEPVSGSKHHFKVLAQLGRGGSITHISRLDNALKDLRALKVFELVFREMDIDEPFGYKVNNPAVDNDYQRSYQVPKTNRPSAPENTVEVDCYQVNFQRGWFMDSKDVVPVRYANAMMEKHNPNYVEGDTNIVEMKWILQRELGSEIVYFHEVNVTPGSFEGVHQHIGSEEVYYIVSGEGLAYMGNDDDPSMEGVYPTVKQEIYCIGEKPVKEVPVSPGKIIFTKSGGIHGIRNTSQDKPLIFVAFGYHCA
jgi:oxalate decarboxylase/phosphoglucose isomerase-like protein (cupin superfamily)